MNAVVRPPPVPGSLSQAAFEQRLRDAVMDAAPLLNARLLPVSVRSAALNRALAAGLPQLRDDLWRYADLKFLGSAPWGPVPAAQDPARWQAAARGMLPERESGFERLVFVNGRHAPELSDALPAFDAALGPVVPERTRHERFGWLNDAFATDLVRLSITDTRRLEIVFVATPVDQPQAVHPRLELAVQPGAALTLLERHVGNAGGNSLINAATQLHVGRNARCQHLREQSLSLDSQLLDTLQVALDADAAYELTLLQMGARSLRSPQRLSLYGAGATGAEVDLRPQLEIHTDQVRASHGATTGALDENMRFYLLARGLDPDTARGLLEWSFLEDAVSRIGDAGLRRLAEQRLVATLGSTVAGEALQ